MKARNISFLAFVVCVTLGLLSVVTGCVPGSGANLGNLLNSDCFVSGAISQQAYDDLSWAEQLEYNKNSCGLYVKRTTENTIEDIADLF